MLVATNPMIKNLYSYNTIIQIEAGYYLDERTLRRTLPAVVVAVARIR